MTESREIVLRNQLADARSDLEHHLALLRHAIADPVTETLARVRRIGRWLAVALATAIAVATTVRVVRRLRAWR